MLARTLVALKRTGGVIHHGLSQNRRRVRGMCGVQSDEGYILIEALIVSALMALGILTMAGLHKTGLRLSYSSFIRSKSTMLAYEMADRVRANMPGQVIGAYDSLTGAASNPGCITTGCTPAQTAQNDFYEWNTELAAALPAGSGVICLTSTPSIGTPASPGCDASGTQYAIKIWWVQKDEKTADTQNLAFFYMAFRP